MHVYFTAQPSSLLEETLKKTAVKMTTNVIIIFSSTLRYTAWYRIGLPHTKCRQKYEHFFHVCSPSAPPPPAYLEVNTSVYLLNIQASLTQCEYILRAVIW